MRIAKEASLTCITPDFQIIYSGAYLTKVGHFDKSLPDRLNLYQSLQIQRQETQKKIKLTEKIKLNKE